MTVDAATTAAVAEDYTSPLWLIRLGFSTPVYLSSRSLTAWDGQSWLPTSARVRGTLPPSLEFFNDGLGLGAAIMAQGTTGRTVSIWKAYKTAAVVAGAPAGYGEPVLHFTGEMSQATVADTIQLTCKKGAPLFSPRTHLVPPICNHLPAAGTRITMPAQVYILE